MRNYWKFVKSLTFTPRNMGVGGCNIRGVISGWVGQEIPCLRCHRDKYEYKHGEGARQVGVIWGDRGTSCLRCHMYMWIQTRGCKMEGGGQYPHQVGIHIPEKFVSTPQSALPEGTLHKYGGCNGQWGVVTYLFKNWPEWVKNIFRKIQKNMEVGNMGLLDRTTGHPG